jgi:hypothetical protein
VFLNYNELFPDRANKFGSDRATEETDEVEDEEYVPEEEALPTLKTVAKPSTTPAIDALNKRLGFLFPKISRIVYNGPVTVVFFEDGSKSKVKAQKGCKADKELGLVYALVKRLVCSPEVYTDRDGYGVRLLNNGEIYGNGFGNLIANAAEAGFDQQAKNIRKEQKLQAARVKEHEKEHVKKLAANDNPPKNDKSNQIKKIINKIKK